MSGRFAHCILSELHKLCSHWSLERKIWNGLLKQAFNCKSIVESTVYVYIYSMQCKKVHFVWIFFQLPVAQFSGSLPGSLYTFLNLLRTSCLFIHNPFSEVLLWYCRSKCSFLYVGRKMFFVCWGFFSPPLISEVYFTVKIILGKPKATSKMCIILFPALEKEQNIKMCCKPHAWMVICYSSVSVR